MSNKNIFIILLVCLFVGGIYYYSNNKESLTEISSLISSDEVISLDKSSQGELDSDSLIRTLNSQMLLVGMINSRNIDPAVDHFNGIREKFTKTKLWTKLDLDSMISSQMGGGSPFPEAQTAGMPKSSAEIFDLIRKEWKGIKEVMLAVSSNTVSVDGPAEEPIKFPKVLLAMNFSDQASQNRVKEVISAQFPQGESTFTQDALTLVRSKENPDHIDITVKSPFGSPLTGSIEFVGTQGLVTFGTNQKNDFFTGGADSASLVDSAQWKQSEPSILPNVGSFVFFDVKGVAEISNEIQKISNIGEDPAAIAAMNKETFNNFGSVGISSNFSDGVKVRTCGVIKDEDIASRYRAMLNWAQADKEVENSSPNLVTAQTVFSTSLSGHFIQAYLDNFLTVTKATTVEELQKIGEKHTPETRRMIENYFALNKLLKANPIRNVSIVINSPQANINIGTIMGGTPPIDSNLLIEFKNSMTPENFAKLSNKIITLFLADSGLVELPKVRAGTKVESATEGSGADVIEILSGSKPQFFGSPISETSFLFGNTQKSLADAKKTLGQPSAVISEEILKARGLKELRSTAGVTTYFSSIPIVQQLHALAPDALAFAPPEMQLTPDDVKEVLNLLNFKIFGMQNSARASEDVYCADMRGIAL